jgi:hypothetical protein
MSPLSILMWLLNRAAVWTIAPEQSIEKQRVLALPRTFDLLRPAERDDIIAGYLNAPLLALGFEQVAPRRWVDGSAAPVRRVFAMQLLKGAAVKPQWGFSLDFVPHLSGDRICWHRSNRTAQFDVVVEMEGRKYASFNRGAAWLCHDLDLLVPPALERAQETWQRGSSFSGILDIVREICERRINSFYVYFSWHLPLTSMFLSAKIGDLSTAQSELEAYARERELDEGVVTKLAELLCHLSRIEKRLGA